MSHEDTLILHGRLRTLRFGAWWCLWTAIGLAVYAAATWQEQRRFELLLIALGVLVPAVGLLRLPVSGIVRSRWREPFFVSWSVALLAAVALGAAFDGGTDSPLAIGLVLPVLFAALTYPAWAKLVVAGFSMSAVVAIALTTASPPATSLLLGTTLAAAAFVCLWHSRDLEGQRSDLALISRTDPLTGALNRRGFEECLQAALVEARIQERPLALVLLDLDDFKAVNDTNGHAAGDDLLQWVVRMLEGMVEAPNQVGRLGGDEFAVLLDESAERARDRAEEVVSILQHRTGSSIGVAAYPIDGQDVEALHHAADAALYERKQGGRRLRPHVRELGWAATLATCVDERMAVQHAHSSGVAELAGAIAERLGWSEQEIGELRLAATLHDVGRIEVPVDILRKPGRLTRAEFEQIERHPEAGAEIVARVDGMDEIARWIRHSHEHTDGGGYPSGLAGEAIPPASRVLLVADAYNAMTSDRAYRRGMSPAEAVAELRLHAGRQFERAAVDALIAHLGHAGALASGGPIDRG